MTDMRFLLGVHRPSWLWRVEDVPLFISHRVLAERRTPFPRATTDWALDSGGFTELKMHGRWKVTPEEYVAAIRRYQGELGRMMWASPQDWMCEPYVMKGGVHKGERYAGTHLTVAEHQQLTVENFVTLRALGPEIPFIPVIQGWEVDDYLRCVDLYAEAGVDLTAEPLVGVGSVCRRQSTKEIAWVFESIVDRGISVHGYGVKTGGFDEYAGCLTSADSQAWSYQARKRRNDRATSCGRKSCANCLHYALEWRERALAGLGTRQMSLLAEGAPA